MANIQFNGVITDGIFSEQGGLNQCFHSMEGKKVKVVVGEYKKRRSMAQNSYYWGVVIPRLLGLFNVNGNEMDDEEMHIYVKEHILKLKKKVFSPEGEFQSIPGSTKKLTTDEFEEAMEKIRVWASEHGLIIPLPNEGILYESFMGN